VVAAQMRLLQKMANTMMEMQAQIRQDRQDRQQPPPPPATPPSDKHHELMSHKPPTFSSSPDPLQADD
jgi:recombinational DNA repair protein RecT